MEEEQNVANEHNADITPEQTDMVVQFSAVTGEEDLDVCQAKLRVSLCPLISRNNV